MVKTTFVLDFKSCVVRVLCNINLFAIYILIFLNTDI